jgi:hypothetical protein
MSISELSKFTSSLQLGLVGFDQVFASSTDFAKEIDILTGQSQTDVLTGNNFIKVHNLTCMHNEALRVGLTF